MAEITFKRTLHPVGHGAFFTEEICIGNVTYNVVYDCGSKSKRIVKWQIQQFAEKNKHIDLIFISHFDSDHINCLKELSNCCKIDENTKIIIPYYYPAFHQIVGFNNSIYLETIEETFAFFNEKKVHLIMVKSSEYYEPGVPIDFRNINGDVIHLSNGITATIIHSGIRICVFNGDDTPVWNYVPFNYGEDNERKIQKKLEELNLVDLKGDLIVDEFKKMLDQSKNCSQSTPKDTRLSELKDVYNSIAHGSINANSLQVLSYEDSQTSGMEYNTELDCIIYVKEKQKWIHDYQCSCLYTGDTDLNISNAINVIKNIRHNYLQDKLMIIQIPHHGSWYNYKSDIISMAEIGFVNFKPKVKYCHFDNNIPIDYIEGNHTLLCVTDTCIYSIARL